MKDFYLVKLDGDVFADEKPHEAHLMACPEDDHRIELRKVAARDAGAARLMWDEARPVPRITSTYDIVTHESAEHGDTAESGWVDALGELLEPDDFDRSEGIRPVDMAIEYLNRQGAMVEGDTLVAYGEPDYRDGSVTTNYFFLEGMTPDEEEQVLDGVNAAWRR